MKMCCKGDEKPIFKKEMKCFQVNFPVESEDEVIW